MNIVFYQSRRISDFAYYTFSYIEASTNQISYLHSRTRGCGSISVAGHTGLYHCIAACESEKRSVHAIPIETIFYKRSRLLMVSCQTWARILTGEPSRRRVPSTSKAKLLLINVRTTAVRQMKTMCTYSLAVTQQELRKHAMRSN